MTWQGLWKVFRHREIIQKYKFTISHVFSELNREWCLISFVRNSYNFYMGLFYIFT